MLSDFPLIIAQGWLANTGGSLRLAQGAYTTPGAGTTIISSSYTTAPAECLGRGFTAHLIRHGSFTTTQLDSERWDGSRLGGVRVIVPTTECSSSGCLLEGSPARARLTDGTTVFAHNWPSFANNRPTSIPRFMLGTSTDF